MKKKLVWVVASLLVGLTLGVGAPALAAPITCIADFPNGIGSVTDAYLAGGGCVIAQDKLFTGFNLGNLPLTGTVNFNLNVISGEDIHQISFNNNYMTGTTYLWSYTVTDLSTTKLIHEISVDYTNVNPDGTSVLTMGTVPGGVPSPVVLDKFGPIATCASGLLSDFSCGTVYSPDLSGVIVNQTLLAHGTISSVTDTIIEKATSVPEPGTLLLLGSGLIGLAGLGWRKN